MKEIEEFLKGKEFKNLYKNLIAGTEVKPMVKGISLKTGQGILKAGSVLGLTTTDNLGILVDKSAKDGSENPVGVLIEEIDTGAEMNTDFNTESQAAFSSDSILSQMFIRGVFHQEALLFAEGTSLSDMEIALRKIGIYARKMY